MKHGHIRKLWAESAYFHADFTLQSGYAYVKMLCMAIGRNENSGLKLAFEEI